MNSHKVARSASRTLTAPAHCARAVVTMLCLGPCGRGTAQDPASASLVGALNRMVMVPHAKPRALTRVAVVEERLVLAHRSMIACRIAIEFLIDGLILSKRSYQ